MTRLPAPSFQRIVLNTLAKVAATQTPDDRAVEQAFAEQAYMQCANKAGILMKTPNLVGFEIVTKNDDNTKLLGIMGYRLGRTSTDQLCYGVCIFLNGKILGTDLLYQCGPKKFRPQNPDWAQYLVDMQAQDYGTPQIRSDTAKLHNQFHPEKFLRTPAVFGKIASAGDLAENWQELVGNWCQQTKVGGVLRDFMVQVGKDTALDTLMDWMSKSASFEEAMATKIPLESWMPPEMVLEKTAAQQDRPVLLYFRGTPTEEMLSGAFNREKVAERLYSEGYAMDAEEDTKAPEHFTEVYDGGTPELRNPTGACVCTLLTAGGDTVKAVVAERMHGSDLTDREDSGCCVPAGSYPSRTSGARTTRHHMVALNTSDSQDVGTLWSGSTPLWSEPQDAGTLAEAGEPVTDISPGNLYCFLDPSLERMTEPVYVLDKTKVGDVWHVNVASYPGSTGRLMIINPDSAKSKVCNVINDKWRVLKVPYSTRSDSSSDNCCGSSSEQSMSSKRAPNWYVKSMAPAGDADVTASMLAAPGIKKASIMHEREGSHDLYTIQVGDRKTLPNDKRRAHLKLAAQLCIHPDMAEEMLKSAKEKGNAKYYLAMPAKLASSMLRIVDSPRFEDTVDPIHQVAVRPDQSAVLRTERTPIFVPNARIGDKQDSTRGVKNTPDNSMEAKTRVPPEMVMTASPDELAQFAETNQIPNVFDHGVMASLAKTYDSQLFLDQYLSKLEDGLDSLGRCLFLYYWKPQDWKQLYGTDDLQELEDQLLNSFKGLGDLLLALLKKSRTSSAHPADK